MKNAIITCVLTFISMVLFAQANISFKEINGNNPMAINSATLSSQSANNSGTRRQQASGDYFEINRNMDSHSSTLANYESKGRLLSSARLSHTLPGGTVVVEHMKDLVIQDYAQTITNNGTSTESFKLFFRLRKTEQ